SAVNIGGQQKPAVRVQIDPAKLAAAGLDLENVRGVIAITTTDSPKGYFDGEHKAFTIYDNDQITEASQYNDMVLAYRNGTPLRVRDVGQAISGPENVKSGAWEQNGKQGIEIL